MVKHKTLVKEIDFLLKEEVTNEEKKLAKRKKIYALRNGCSNIFHNVRVCLCGRLSQKHSYYEDKILRDNGFVSKTGKNAHIVVIPNNKTAKDMKSKKFTEALPTAACIITETTFCELFNSRDIFTLKMEEIPELTTELLKILKNVNWKQFSDSNVEK
jgi:hypothetical protein